MKKKNNAKFNGHYVHQRTHLARTKIPGTHAGGGEMTVELLCRTCRRGRQWREDDTELGTHTRFRVVSQARSLFTVNLPRVSGVFLEEEMEIIMR